MNKLVYIVVFIVAYLIFAIATLPANQVIRFVTLPKNVQISGVSGTVWQGELQQLKVANTLVNQVNWQLSPWSLLLFDPTVTTTFGGSNVDGPEGKAEISGLISQRITVNNAEVLVAANDVVAQLPMPVPLTAEGSIRLNLPRFKMGQPVCEEASGKIDWRNAEVTAFQEQIALDDLAATVGCDQGALAIIIDGNNILGLEFTAKVTQLNRVTGTGTLTPGAQFPQKLKPALPFIGRADSRGRYQLKI